jgi:hypothetical protein
VIERRRELIRARAELTRLAERGPMPDLRPARMQLL